MRDYYDDEKITQFDLIGLLRQLNEYVIEHPDDVYWKQDTLTPYERLMEELRDGKWHRRFHTEHAYEQLIKTSSALGRPDLFISASNAVNVALPVNAAVAVSTLIREAGLASIEVT